VFFDNVGGEVLNEVLARINLNAIAVSHTVERINHVEGMVDRYEFLAQSLDVTIDCTVVDMNVIGICCIH